MPIVIDEVSAEIVPEQRNGSRSAETRESGRQPRDLEDRVRAVLARERRRAERLSDR